MTAAIEVFQFPFNDLPGKTRFGGYVYVAEFDNGTVKVGMTSDPRSRLAAYASSAGVFEVHPLRGWLSPLHLNPGATEKTLRDAFAALGSIAAGREWFTEVSFEDAVSTATSLPLMPVDLAVEEAKTTRDADGVVTMLASLGGAVEKQILRGQRQGSVVISNNSLSVVAYMLAAVDGIHGLPQGSEPEPRHFAAARAVLDLLNPRLGWAS